MVERIAHKHTSMNIQPEHYNIVGHHLIETLRELAPEQFTADIEAAWVAAYQVLAGIFIDKEAGLYNQRDSALGGWKGGRAFKLIEKHVESELVKSFIFEPCDGGAVINYQAGQYIGIEVDPGRDKEAYREIRQYSLSNKANGKNYRISVKREDQGKPGIVSNYLHDTLGLGDEVILYPPAGDFYLQDNAKAKVLISAGVGLTPMQAMLETLIARQETEQEIHFLHACENAAQHSFKKRHAEVAQQGKVTNYTWYKADDTEAASNSAELFNGYMDISQVEHQLPLANADFYLCGPVSFMQFAKQQLVNLGVNNNSIHYEVFGPHESL
jgi:nitric oxide dioxygenase